MSEKRTLWGFCQTLVPDQAIAGSHPYFWNLVTRVAPFSSLNW